MSRKQLFILIGVLASICVCVAGLSVAGLAYLGNSFGKVVENADDPANIRKIAAEIADYTPPTGYKELAMDLMLYKYIMLAPAEKASTSGQFIVLMSFPSNSNMDDKQMREQMQRAFAEQTGQQADMKVKETKTVSIRGKDTTATILEGKTNAGLQMRQWLAVFEGKNGLVMLMFSGVSDLWNDKLVDDFVESIK